MHHIRHEAAREKTGIEEIKNAATSLPLKFCHSLAHTRVEMFPHLSLFILCYDCYVSVTHRKNCSSVPSIKNSKESCSSPLGGLPHPAAVVSVEVGGQVLLLVHATGLDQVREAQRPEGQRLHGLLNQLDVTSSACRVRLGEGGEDTASCYSFLLQLVIPFLMYACGVSMTECTVAIFSVLSLSSYFSFSLLLNFNRNRLPFFLAHLLSSSSYAALLHIHRLTLSKMPHSQMSCSLALVLMAMVKRTCGMSSWEKERQSTNQSINP